MAPKKHDEEQERVAGFTERLGEAIARMGGRSAVAHAHPAIERNTLDNWLSGRRAPSLAKLAALASVLKVSVDWLLLGTDIDVHEKSQQFGEPEPRPLTRRDTSASVAKLDINLLAEILSIVEGESFWGAMRSRPRKRAELVAREYAICIQEQCRPTRTRILRLLQGGRAS